MPRRRTVYDAPVWQVLRKTVFARDAWRCQVQLDDGRLCAERATCVDHIVPLSEGGAAYDLTNLRAACASCNGRLAAKRRAELAQIAIHGDRAYRGPSRDW